MGGIAVCAGLVTAGVSIAAHPVETVDEPSTFFPAAASLPLIVTQPVEPMVAVADAHFTRTFDVSSFRRGNLHTHSNRSDGDSDPSDVYTWYRDHGYDFVAVTDHNTFTNPADFHSLETPTFVIIGGEEVTMRGAGRQVHVNALCTGQRFPGGRFPSAGEALTFGVDEIRRSGGIAIINHPNFTWGISSTDLAAASGAQLIEIQSGHPYVRSQGNASHPSHEALWDIGLTAGLDFMGVAVDDAHHLRSAGRGRLSRPGRAWVEVFAESLDEATICRSLAGGLLYASTGPSLRRISVTADTYSVWPVEHEAEVQFIGSGGRLLATRQLDPDNGSAAYQILGSEGYVRARVMSDGKMAWTPAVRVAGSGHAHATTESDHEEKPPG